MQHFTRRTTPIMSTWFLFFAIAAGGCTASGVGDPCTPESIPTNGFQASEAYLESSSVQCRTRVCLVYKLQGDPTVPCEQCPTGDATCRSRCARTADIQDRVLCTCRCSGPDPNARYCGCPDGFVCRTLLESGGIGIQGGYCVKSSLAASSAM